MWERERERKVVSLPFGQWGIFSFLLVALPCPTLCKESGAHSQVGKLKGSILQVWTAQMGKSIQKHRERRENIWKKQSKAFLHHRLIFLDCLKTYLRLLVKRDQNTNLIPVWLSTSRRRADDVNSMLTELKLYGLLCFRFLRYRGKRMSRTFDTKERSKKWLIHLLQVSCWLRMLSRFRISNC